MGGHSSKQTVAMSASVVASAVQTVTQDCINYVYGGNTININGVGNVVSGVNQSMAIKVDASCSAQVTQAAAFASSMQNNVSQIMKDQEVAMTQWMDCSSDNSSTNISQSVAANITSATVQTCLNSINAQNILNVSGTGNVVTNVVQAGTVNLLSQCLLGQAQTSSTVNTMTSTVNQHSSYNSQNPFAFITDAIQAVFKSALVAVVGIFVLIIGLIFVYMVLRHRRHNKAAAQPTFIMMPSAAAPVAAAAPAAAPIAAPIAAP